MSGCASASVSDQRAAPVKTCCSWRGQAAEARKGLPNGGPAHREHMQAVRGGEHLPVIEKTFAAAEHLRNCFWFIANVYSTRKTVYVCVCVCDP